MRASDVGVVHETLMAIGQMSMPSINQTLAVARAIGPALVEVERAAAEVRRRHKALLAQYAAKDAQGRLRTSEDGSRYVFDDADAEAAFQREYAALMAEDVGIEARVSLDGLGDLPLTPVQLVPLVAAGLVG